MALTLSQEKPKIANFLAEHNIGIIATSSKDGLPHAATVYFTIDKDLDVYFMTKTDTTKSRNLSENPRASLAVFEAPKLSTVQIHGSVQLIEDDARRNEVFKRISAVATANNANAELPIAELPAGNLVVYKLTPSSIRLAEYNAPDHQSLDNIFDVAILPNQQL